MPQMKQRSTGCASRPSGQSDFSFTREGFRIKKMGMSFQDSAVRESSDQHEAASNRLVL